MQKEALTTRQRNPKYLHSATMQGPREALGRLNDGKGLVGRVRVGSYNGKDPKACWGTVLFSLGFLEDHGTGMNFWSLKRKPRKQMHFVVPLEFAVF